MSNTILSFFTIDGSLFAHNHLVGAVRQVDSQQVERVLLMFLGVSFPDLSETLISASIKEHDGPWTTQMISDEGIFTRTAHYNPSLPMLVRFLRDVYPDYQTETRAWAEAQEN